jgi:zinc D-Ala-D-Ala dipeptidase
MATLPNGFVYLDDPRIILTMSYATENNFLGRIVKDYLAPVCILTKEAAAALMKVQDALEKYHPNYHLKIFDAYRPTTAVSDFKVWANDAYDQKMKALYYPDIDKPSLFEQGYIAEKSGHSRGSTVDLTITVLKDEMSRENLSLGPLSEQKQIIDVELPMGTPFDFFGDSSHTANKDISDEAKRNRQLLKDLMESAGFENYKLEWWHYTLKNEPFPDTYFSFPIK